MKGLKKKAWTVFSLWIRNRDRACVTCGSTKDLTAGHIIHKDCLDFNEIAINAQCRNCNYFKSGNLFEYSIYLKNKYGADILDKLKLLGNQTHKFSREELETIIQKYKGVDLP